MTEATKSARATPSPPQMKGPRNLRAVLWVFCFALLALGFYGSWVKFWSDQNWFARSGGLVTFIAGWNVLATDAMGQFLDRQGAAHIEWLNRTGPRITGVEELYETFTSRIKRAMKIADLSLLGLGTLVWALGDLIQFCPR